MDHASFSKYIENIYILKKCFSKHQDFVQHLTNFKVFFSNVFRSAKMAESDKKNILCVLTSSVRDRFPALCLKI